MHLLLLEVDASPARPVHHGCLVEACVIVFAIVESVTPAGGLPQNPAIAHLEFSIGRHPDGQWLIFASSISVLAVLAPVVEAMASIPLPVEELGGLFRRAGEATLDAPDFVGMVNKALLAPGSESVHTGGVPMEAIRGIL